MSAQLKAVEQNKGVGNVLNGEAIALRVSLIGNAKADTAVQYDELLKYTQDILNLKPNDATAIHLEKLLKQSKTNLEQGLAMTKKVTENQTENLSREKKFADQSVSWSGLLSMVRQAKT